MLFFCGRHGAWRADRITGGVRVFCLQIMAAARMMVRNVREHVKRVMLRDV